MCSCQSIFSETMTESNLSDFVQFSRSARWHRKEIYATTHGTVPIEITTKTTGSLVVAVVTYSIAARYRRPHGIVSTVLYCTSSTIELPGCALTLTIARRNWLELYLSLLCLQMPTSSLSRFQYCSVKYRISVVPPELQFRTSSSIDTRL